MPIKKTLLVLLLLFFAVYNNRAQIFAPAASDSFNAIYDNTGNIDEVFVFNRTSFKADIIASIIASSTDHLTGWTFQWYVYNPLTVSYTSLLPTSSGSSAIIDTITVSSGYQVIMSKGALTETFRVWIIMNDLDVKITNKDENDILKYGYYNCESLDLRADTTRIPLFYYNPQSGLKITPSDSYVIRWRTDNPDASNPQSRLLTRVTDPPWKNTWYIIRITDNFKIEREDSVFYTSIQSKANITTEYIPLSDETEYPNRHYGYFYKDDILSAPGKYKFDISGSFNMENYKLNFGDGDSIMLDKDSLIVIHEYKKPGIYKAVLTTKSFYPPYECEDSMSVNAELKFASGANFNMPNVFTPDNSGDGSDVFKPGDILRTTDVSVLNISITIFSRTGLKVHQYDGNIRDWNGWDGKILNSGRNAPEGVYFYVISRLDAYSDKTNPIDRSLTKGFIHLYRK